MYQAVKMSCALLDLVAHVVVDLHVEDVRHKVERILVVLHFRVQTSKVESVCQVVFINFAKVFIATG